MVMTTEVIKLPGDTRFECPKCQWAMTLTESGALIFTHNGEVRPRCGKCDVELRQTRV